VTLGLHGLVVGELLVTTLVLLVVYGRHSMARWVFQLRRHSHMKSAASSVLPALGTALGVVRKNAIRTKAWFEEFANDADFLRANGISPAELESLKNASFMGSVTSKEDLLLILETIRGGTGRRPQRDLGKARHKTSKRTAE
jgi:hypothetical protein